MLSQAFEGSNLGTYLFLLIMCDIIFEIYREETLTQLKRNSMVSVIAQSALEPRGYYCHSPLISTLILCPAVGCI